MSRRPLAIALILFGIAVIVVAIVWLLLPLFRKNPAIVVQPPPLEDTLPKEELNQPSIPEAPLIALNQAGIQERQAQEALRRFAQEFASRVGTYSNADEFGSIRQTYIQTTPEVKIYLEGLRQELLKSHPPLKTSWGQTTRGLTSRIISPLPLLNRVDAEVSIQALVTVETIEGTQRPTYKEIIVSFTREDPRLEWSVGRIESQDF